MSNCFVNHNITGGIKNIESSLQQELVDLFSESNVKDEKTGKTKSKIYAKLVGKNSEYKQKLGIDWETKAGNEKINSLGQQILGENNEPKLYVDKIGVAYFKLLNGKRFIVNNQEISITERLNIVNSITARYIENSNVPLVDFVKKTIKENRKTLVSNGIAMRNRLLAIEARIDQGIHTAEEKKEGRLLGKKVKLANKHASFLQRAFANESVTTAIVKEVEAGLNDSGMNYVEDPTSKEGEDASTMDFGFLLSSDQVSSQKGMPSVIRALINGISVEKRSYVGDEVIIGEEMLESMPLLKKVESSAKVFKSIEKELSGTIAPRVELDASTIAKMSAKELKAFNEKEGKKYDVFDVMINKLRTVQVEKDDAILRQVLNKLDNLLAEQKSEKDRDNIKTKFFLAFNKSKVANKMFIISERTRETDSSVKILNLNAIDVSNDENKKTEIASELVTNMFQEFTRKDRNEEEIIKSLNGNLQFRGNFKVYLEKRYGMILQDKTIDQLIKANAERGITNKQFVDNMSSMVSLLSPAAAIEIIKKEKKGTIALAQLYNIMGMEDRVAIVESFAVNKGNYSEIKTIAEFEAENRPSDGESSIVVGGTKRWLYSLMSKFDLDIARWKAGDLTQLRDLENTGNEVVDFLLAKDVDGANMATVSKARIASVGMKNNTEIRKKLDSDPTMFNNLTIEDLINSVYSELYESKKEIFENKDSLSDAGNNKNLEIAIATKESRNTMVLLTNEAKTRTFSFSGVTTGNSGVVMENGLVSSAGLVNIERMKNLFYGEIFKIQKTEIKIQEYKELATAAEKKKFAAANFIPGWHFASQKGKDYFNPKNQITDEEFEKGKYRQFGFLNEFYLDNKEEIDSRYMAGEEPRAISATEIFNLDEQIDSYLSKILNKDVANFNKLYGSKNNAEFGEAKDANNKKLLELETNLPSVGSAEEKAANLSANYLFKNIAMFNLFNGEIGMYAQKGAIFNTTDAFKRTSAPGADGKYTRHSEIAVAYYMPHGSENLYDSKGKVHKKAIPYLKNSKTIIATVADQEYDDSAYSPQMNKVLKEMGRTSKKALKLEGVVADGSTMASPDFLFNFYSKVYGHDENDVRIHNELLNPKTKLLKEHYDFLKKIGGSQQAAKLQSFSQSKINGTAINFFLKTSVMPMYPALTQGFPIDRLREAMVNKGVDLVAMDSAVKGSKPMSTTIHHPNDADNKIGTIKEVKDIQLNPFEINTEDIKIQVELSAKGDKESLAGNQHMKNLLANMDMSNKDKTFNYRGVDLNAKQMYQKYNQAVIDVVEDQLQKFIVKIGKKSSDFDQSIFRQMILDQLDDADYNLKELLKDTFNPIEIVPGMANKAFSVVSSYILKKVAKPATNGMAAIQVANYGFNALGSDAMKNTIMIKEVSELKPPRPTSLQDYLDRYKGEELDKATEAVQNLIDEYNEKNKAVFNYADPIYFAKNEDGKTEVSLIKKEGFYATIEKGQIMLPFNSLFKKSGMNWEEFSEFMKDKNNFDERILSKVLGYRIPNQSVSSNDSFEIVGILHPSAGDSAVIYHEITAKTGSDFDIDKMVLMMPNFKANTEFVIDEIIDNRNRKITEDIKDSKNLSTYMKTGPYKNIEGFLAVLIRDSNSDFAKIIAEGASQFRRNNKINTDQLLKFFYNNREKLDEAISNDESMAIINGVKSQYTVAEVFDDLYNAMSDMNDDISQELSIHKLKNNARSIAQSFEYIEDNSTKGLQNKLIEAMTSILESSSTFDDLISPLDGTYIKDKIQEVNYIYSLTSGTSPESEIARFNELSEEAKTKAVKEYIDTTKLSAMESMSLYNLAKIRVDMLMAKGLTATMANHMSDIPFGQIKKAFLKYNIGLGDGSFANVNVIGKEKDFDFKITKMVSYLMNASVDASKDNYIVEGNFNSYTSGAAMLLVRLGIDPLAVSKIIMHPDIVSLSKEKLASTGKTTEIKASYSQKELDTISKLTADKINRGLKINADNFVKLSYSPNIKDDKGNVIMERSDVLGFWNILVTLAKEMNNDIAVSKPDTNGAGKSISEAHAVMNLHKIMRGNAVGYHDKNGNIIAGGKVKKDGITENDVMVSKAVKSGTFLEKIMDSSVMLSNELTKNMFIEKTAGYYNLTNRILSLLGDGYSTSDDKIKKIHNSLYPFILSSMNHEATNIDQQTSDYLLDDFASDLLKLKNNSEHSENEFLKELYIDSASGFINFKNTSNYTENVKRSIEEGMSALYENEQTRDVAVNLVKYSFLTTGFKPSSYGYVDYLPNQYFVDSGYGVAVKNMISRLNSDMENPGDEMVSDAIIFMATNRSNDEDFVSNVKIKKAVIKENEAIKDSYLLGKLNMKNEEKSSERFTFFAHTSNNQGHKYFMLTGMDTGVDKKGETLNYPIYTEVNVMIHTDKVLAEKLKKTKREDLSKKQKASLNAEERNGRLVLFNSNLNKQENLIKNYEKNGPRRLLLSDTSQDLVNKNDEIKFNLNPSKSSLSFEEEIEEEEVDPDFEKMKQVLNDYSVDYLNENRGEITDLLISLANGNLEALAKAEALLTNKCE